MSWHHSTPKHTEIDVGSDYVTVRGKYDTTVARILRDETTDNTRKLTLDRLLDRNAQVYVEHVDGCERQWQAAGAFVSVLTTEGTAQR
jgi:hypothetical protein